MDKLGKMAFERDGLWSDARGDESFGSVGALRQKPKNKQVEKQTSCAKLEKVEKVVRG